MLHIFIRWWKRKCKELYQVLHDSDGNKVENLDQLKITAVEFYQHLLGLSEKCITEKQINRINQVLRDQISDAQKEILQIDMTELEVQWTLFSQAGDKSLGPDGFTAYFIEKAWSILKDDVIKAIPSLFELSRLLWEINDTIITLVPKVTNSSIIGEFRPISCYNVIYKCHTKIPG